MGTATTGIPVPEIPIPIPPAGVKGKEQLIDGGMGPAFPIEKEMPVPPVRSVRQFRALLAVMGPAVIALGGTIGGGEWLIGPGLFVQFGLVLLWITTVSCTFQVILNQEMVRYTMYTGEPITLGFMRLKPGKAFWGWLFVVAGFIERSMPGWALGTGTALAAGFMGKIPAAADRPQVITFAIIVVLLCALLVSIGRRIERTLEIANWVMMVVVLGGLFILDLLVVPGNVWGEAFAGYVSFGAIPKGVSILMLGALVGYSAYGGFGNNCITNWYRDKGYGMGSKVGFIPTLVGGAKMKVSPHGMMPAQTEENKSRFKGWWKLLSIDQWAVFWVGGMIGMLLPGVLYVAMMPRGQALPSWGIAASTASGLLQRFGGFGFYLAVFFGFWILFSTALSNTDLVCRQATDMLWFASPKVRAVAKEDIRYVYYAIMALVVIFGIVTMNWLLPAVALALSANIASFTMALSAILTIRLNRKFLPAEYRPPVWREIVLIATLLFFGFFFCLFLLSGLPTALGMQPIIKF